MDVYVPGTRPAAFIPNDKEPSAAEGRISQLLLADLARITVGTPLLAESVEVLFAVLLFCITEKVSDVGENDNAEGTATVRVTCRVALA